MVLSPPSQACGDIKFYLIEVKFDALPDEAEHTYFTELPTSCKLSDEAVDRLRDAAHRRLTRSDAFVSVPYRNHWFWIDDKDLGSKGLFSFLMFILNLVDTGVKEGAPVVTIPAR